jgi:hypothetical protein
MMKRNKLLVGIMLCLQLAILAGCGVISESMQASQPTPTTTAAIERESLIPADAVKMSPETDQNPPILYSDDFEAPVPVPGLVNTAGAEDGVFVTLDGNTLYFFFTPDVDVPTEKQILDGVTGLYVSHKTDGIWGEPERIIMHDPGKLAVDGCEFVQGNVMWFCSAREGYTGLHWFTAEFQDGAWRNWQNADFDPTYQVGELYISGDGRQLYFHSERPGGKGGLDIWVSQMLDGIWQEPVNLAAVNTPDNDGWPALSVAEDELWITRNWGVWRAKKVNGEWQEAELIVSPLAGEASLDAEGNLYFVHHYYVDGRMIEADIYVAYKR